jgi:hypothetical protein
VTVVLSGRGVPRLIGTGLPNDTPRLRGVAGSFVDGERSAAGGGGAARRCETDSEPTPCPKLAPTAQQASAMTVLLVHRLNFMVWPLTARFGGPSLVLPGTCRTLDRFDQEALPLAKGRSRQASHAAPFTFGLIIIRGVTQPAAAPLRAYGSPGRSATSCPSCQPSRETVAVSSRGCDGQEAWEEWEKLLWISVPSPVKYWKC